jgi:carbamoyltransferase
MAILGVNFSGREPSACIVAGNELVAAVEEDRFTRDKFAEDRLPYAALEFCLRQSGLAPRDIECIAFPWDCNAYADGSIAAMYRKMNAAHKPDAETLHWQEANLRTFHPQNVERHLGMMWQRIAAGTAAPSVKFVPHHYAHACGAFFSSHFEDALVVVIDGNGDRECTSVWAGSASGLERLGSVEMPHSLGWFYSTMSNFLGFPDGSGEPKVMGLAAYGNETAYLQKLGELLAQDRDGWRYTVKSDYLYSGEHSFSSAFTDALAELLELLPRDRGTPLDDKHRDLAYATQALLEAYLVRLIRHWMAKTGLRNLCLNGGVALNCKANHEVWRAVDADAIYIPPAASDAGQCIGAAAAALWDRDRVRLAPIGDADYGPAFDDSAIDVALRHSGYARDRPADLARTVALAVESGAVIGWFEGRMEIGPRALGRRSIIADPRFVAIRDRINCNVKKREPWRPLCPSILEEHAAEYLEHPTAAPFMNIAFKVRDLARDRLAGVVHVDGTTRPHLVNRKRQPRYWDAIEAFRQRTGVPAFLNTSFNVDGEPIVLSPEHAIRCFAGSDLDAMVIGGYYVTKARVARIASAQLPPADMIRIPAGAYPIGPGRIRFQLDAFEIARTPVSNAEYAPFLEWLNDNGDESVRHPLQPSGKTHVPQQWGDPEWRQASCPVVGVDWWDAWAYAKWRRMRLPTEIEWEAAAAGPDGLRFPWGETWQHERCNSAHSYDKAWRDGRTTPVDAFPQGASPFGVLDMMGNVWEWTSSAYVPGPLRRDPPPYDANGPVAIRGGSFRRGERFQRCTTRCDSEVDVRAPNNGFRLCRSIL